MDALDLREWIEELTLTRESARKEAEHWQAENKILQYAIARLETELAAKDAEIARLKETAIIEDIATPQPAQEQADEHPAKKGWVELLGTRVCNWSPSERLSTLEETWVLAKDWWYGQKPEVIAAYDRYMAQQGGPGQ